MCLGARAWHIKYLIMIEKQINCLMVGWVQYSYNSIPIICIYFTTYRNELSILRDNPFSIGMMYIGSV